MNYSKIYDSIIHRAKPRGLDKSLLDFYSENHHIHPRCMGGVDDDFNRVLLIAREHFIAHWLLTKIYPSNYKLKYAFSLMSQSGKFHERIALNSNEYSASKKALVEATSLHFKGCNLSEEHKKKISESNMGKKLSETHKARILEANKRFHANKPKKIKIRKRDKSLLMPFIDKIESIWVSNNKPKAWTLRQLCVASGLPDQCYKTTLKVLKERLC